MPHVAHKPQPLDRGREPGVEEHTKQHRERPHRVHVVDPLRRIRLRRVRLDLGVPLNDCFCHARNQILNPKH